MISNNGEPKGLTDEQVLQSRSANGANVLTFKKESAFLAAVKSIIKEPMVILLLITACIYFISGEIADGTFLSIAVIIVSGISLYQDSRSRNALAQLKEFAQPKCKVIRNGATVAIRSDELVVGDSMMIEEGSSVSADGVIISSNDFSVNESILTGESLPVFKDHLSEDNVAYQGTIATSGLAIIKVTAIGNKTSLGKIGQSLDEIKEEKTPLELQINDFVKKMVVAGAVVFVIVWAINYFHSHLVLDSLIKALTLAMSILPEEIPVAFASFMALGAWRLMKMGVVVKQMKTVETLGSASVICVDKTGTITENRMTLAKVYTPARQRISGADEAMGVDEKELITVAMWASEPIPFDPMEVALHDAYIRLDAGDERAAFKMIHEYPLSGKPPMMTHLFENAAGKRIIAAKGAPEALMAVCDLSAAERRQVLAAISELSVEGYRILGVGAAQFSGSNFPATQQEFPFSFKGLVAFYDPPKKNIEAVLHAFYKAGIAVKIITGDNAETTGAIARQVGFKNADQCVGGEELMKLSDAALLLSVERASIFTRMFPEAKLRIVNALKQQNEIVAMTGDGVNDGPALKAAHIGIAMGKKGTEIARQAASLILLDDDLSKMVDAVAMGRKIYANLKKAIQYIISIHVPIILIVFIPLVLGWVYPNIFTPMHIIFLELVMGPTCSIIFENEPLEQYAMQIKPRSFTTTFFNSRELATSLVQGLVISAGTLITYQYALLQGYNESVTRTMIFTALIVANVFLTLVNRSFYYSLIATLKYANNLVMPFIAVTLFITTCLIYIRPVALFFEFQSLNSAQLLVSVSIGCLSVTWYELVKWRKRAVAKVEP